MIMFGKVHYDRTPDPLTQKDYSIEYYRDGKLFLISLCDDTGHYTGGVNLSIMLPNETNQYMGDYPDKKRAIKDGKHQIDTYWKMEKETAKSMERVNRRGKQQ